MKQTILAAGGAGYIGSHTVLELLQHNYHVVVIDKLCTTRINHPNVAYFQCDIADAGIIKTICQRYTIDAVVHCAAYIEVGASVVHPASYYENNVIKSFQFIENLRQCGINNIIFSSSAAVYGMPTTLPIPETHACNPINPYGMTKLMVEQLLADYHTAYGTRYIALRYFNAAGAHPAHGLGERHTPETHLIPRLLNAAREGEAFTLYGNDYPTPDGTCVRDYVHVRDIAAAHRLSVEYLTMHDAGMAINLGNGTGFSVRTILQAVEDVVGHSITVSILDRRAGDPAYLVADTQRAQEILGWQPRFSDIKTIIADAYAFEVSQRSAVFTCHAGLACPP